ncbi:MAG TPA: hypothetical protein VMD78_02905, partial [Candidatus Baltobacteraceae bacterium]|nr:hypothetical protein [Candidatus Baltobacteraceae bacterium]
MDISDKLKSSLERVESAGMVALDPVQTDVMDFLDGLKQHLIQNPEPVFAILRRVKPILIVKDTAVVTLFEDVQEVLSRDDVFQVTYREKMEVIGGGSNFFLGMQNSPDYERDVSHMRTVIRREDLPGRVLPFVSATAEGLVAASGGRLDVVQQLGRVVPTCWVVDYFGCLEADENQLAADATVMFQ